MSRNKSNGRGRPQKENQDNQEDILLDDNYIATNELALKLLEIISSFASYKLLTITGPNGQKNNEETKLRRKNVEKVQIKIREKLKIQEDYTFFLRDLDNCTISYELNNNELIDRNRYQLNMEEFQNLKINPSILHSIELVNNQLNQELQQFLIEFIKQYSYQQDLIEQFKESFFDYILNNPDKFQEIINWSQLYDASYDEKTELLKLEVKYFKKKFMANEQIQSKKYKVDEKRENQLKQDLSQIQKLENNKGDYKSLKLLINDITETLKQFWGQNNI
ncbi:unnamed protein product [Paramecium pentaurelia]|uniref:Uncharacterized protein n=1 Tax=Paramecium pentaurelia TaxID=43138 RepID=A0A8S1X1Y2_9CILI|nr:unnamed protein product [Paramecium pentaurelia]